MKKIISALIFFGVLLASYTQTFTEVTTGLPGLYKNTIAWGDYDNDGDLDVLMAGETSSGRITRIYNNDHGSFTDINAELPGISDGSASWGDYNNDNFLDFIITGETGSTSVSKIYKNNGNSTFSDINAGLPGIEHGSSEWGDYDNDGDLDIIITGYNGKDTISSIYCNNGDDTFTNINAGLIPIYYFGTADWADYDNDCDLDILITGDSHLGTISKIYRNDDGVFTDINAGLLGVFYSSADWGDYDNDGDIDIILCGRQLTKENKTGEQKATKIYRNDNGVFTDINSDIIDIECGTVLWGDCDNDGDLDILISGLTDPGYIYTSRIYRNNGDDTFSDINAGLNNICDYSATWADYDNDGDLDILLSGYVEYYLGTLEAKLYKNESTAANIPPKKPSNLSSEITDNGIMLSWDKSTDTETLQNGLSYNIYIGTTSQSGNTLDGMSIIETGRRKIVTIGNAQQNTSWKLDLPNGNYFWSVQAIDHAFAGSEFANEKSFTIDYPPPPPPVLAEATGIIIRRFSLSWGPVERATGYYLDVAYNVDFTDFVPGYENLNLYNFTSTTVENYEINEVINYYCRIRAYNPNGTGLSSNVITVTTLIDPFVEVNAGLPEDFNGKVAWGDYNNDGNLDILISGNNDDYAKTRLFRNNGNGTFSENYSELPEMYTSSVDWGDYDNDGFLDILYCGYTWINYTSTYYSKIYRNKHDGTFEDINAALPAAGTALWWDYNNDGNLDILINNYRILKNCGNGIFSDINAGLIKVTESSSAWGDYDNDRDLDVIISGQSGYQSGGYGLITRIYRNDGDETFTDINAGLIGTGRGSLAWGDYDNDGDLDILISGDSDNSLISWVYRNDGNDVFTDINAKLPFGYLNFVNWGDYDNDGDLDIIITGLTIYGSPNHLLAIYRNNGDDTFTDINAGLPIDYFSFAKWGDYDNDGAVDILLSGRTMYSTGERLIKLYKNNCLTFNTAPNKPINLISEIIEKGITLSWDKATDNETPQDGLSYNIYVGTESQKGDILDPQSIIETGQRKVVSIGNAQQNTSWSLELSNGNYYWGVQAVDHTFAGSEFATESQFTINYPLPDAPVANSATNIVIDKFTANWEPVSLASGYLLDVATDAGFTNFITGYQKLDVRKATAFNVDMTGLTSEITFYYRVKAYNLNGEGQNSYTVVVNTLEDPFIEIPVSSNLENLHSPVVWGDYDNDGFLDILAIEAETDTISVIYHNDGDGVFTDTDIRLKGAPFNTGSWTDFNNDGYMDILTDYTGPDYLRKTFLYCNNGNGTFSDINAGLVGLIEGTVAWGDYDNDGDLDILMSGVRTEDPYSMSYRIITYLYRNEANKFICTDSLIQGIYNGSVEWGDFDNDNDLDILLTGYGSDPYDPIPISRVYRNENGIFEDINAGLLGVGWGSGTWGDFDSDGYLDIFISGSSSYPYKYSKVYRNNRNGTFTDINAGLTGSFWSTINCLDYDNDGDQDILISGDSSDGYISKIYRNDYSVFNDINTGIIGLTYRPASIVDIDNDGDLDIFISGYDESEYKWINKLYLNNCSTPNSKPNAPVNLASAITETDITLSWSKATDNETPQDGLSYNIYIGTSSQSEDIYSPMSDVFTGNRRIVSMGNVNQNTSWPIKNLPAGEFFWSVQAIDNAFAGSEFAEEQTFIVTGIEDNTIPLTTELYQNYPNPFNPVTKINYSLSEASQVELNIFNIKSEFVRNLVNSKIDKGNHSVQFNADDLTTGLYFCSFKVDGVSIQTRKMMLLK